MYSAYHHSYTLVCHLEIPAIDRKRALLKKTIEAEYARAHPWDQLAIFETLAEAVTDAEQFPLRTSHGVDSSNLPLDDRGLYSTGIAVSQFTFLQRLHLENCAIQALHLRSLEIGIRRCNSKQLQVRATASRSHKIWCFTSRVGLGNQIGILRFE